MHRKLLILKKNLVWCWAKACLLLEYLVLFLRKLITYSLTLFRFFASLFNFSYSLTTLVIIMFFILPRCLWDILTISGTSQSLLDPSISPQMVFCDTFSLVIDVSIILVFMLQFILQFKYTIYHISVLKQLPMNHNSQR